MEYWDPKKHFPAQRIRQPGVEGIAPQVQIVPQSTGADQFNVEQLNQLDITRRIANLEEDFRKLKGFFNVSTVTLNSLGSRDWELSGPLYISIEQRGVDDFVACLYDANLFGYGDTIPAALADLKVAIVNQLEYLIVEEPKTEFSKPLKDQLDFLKNMIVSKNA